ncbi:MAG: hypothetical protein KDD34_09370 [Bdellovibrionales bacterium]|nr:hypothetical protein [Bdellovibrionales bacterium]
MDILSCHDARAFLQEALALHYKNKGRVNISDFSRRAGFLSRSFVGEYLSGKKGLSVDALKRIKAALKLPRDYIRFFELLVYLEQPELRPRYLTTEKVLESIEQIKLQLLKKVSQPSEIKKLIQRPIALQIYAAMGSVTDGATLEEICFRSRVKKSITEEVLSLFIQHNLVEIKNEKYFPIASRLDYFNVTEPEGLAKMIEQVCLDIKWNAADIISDPGGNLFYTAFSMSRSRRMEFRRELRELIFDLIDRYQEEPGDYVQKVFFCSH